MKQINNYILEKFIINSKTKLSEWNIKNAEDGDFVKIGNIYFIFKCFNTGHKYAKKLSEDGIVYHAYYNTNSHSLLSDVGMGVGGPGDGSRFYLLDDDEKENFIQILYDKGYEWDDNKKELVKI